ncbi:MAG: YfiR family protein [Acidobacteriales bacterium]|nr:YfiR family protein [Terriglobales bacterium]
MKLRVPGYRAYAKLPPSSGEPVSWLAKVIAVLLVMLMSTGQFLSSAWCQSGAPDEYQVKGAFLYNFAKFVEWPPDAFRSPDAPFEICVLGVDPFDHGLEVSIAGKLVNGRRLLISHVPRPFDARACHILFIAPSEKDQLKQILQGLAGASVLTVADTPGFTGDGGAINFVLEGKRVRFEINEGAARQAHLRLSASLLTVARSVVGRPPAEKP